MNVTDKETERFLNLVQPKCRSYAIETLSSAHASFVCINTNIKGHISYNYISVIDKATTKVIGLDPALALLEEDDVSFIVSYISRCFDKFKLIFSSSMNRTFAESTSNMSVAIRSRVNDGVFRAKLLCSNKCTRMLNLSENNADVSDELWDIILSDRANVNRMMSEYVSDTYSASDNIKKRIQALYDSLSDSDKLLLELGEDLTNI